MQGAGVKPNAAREKSRQSADAQESHDAREMRNGSGVALEQQPKQPRSAVLNMGLALVLGSCVVLATLASSLIIHDASPRPSPPFASPPFSSPPAETSTLRNRRPMTQLAADAEVVTEALEPGAGGEGSVVAEGMRKEGPTTAASSSASGKGWWASPELLKPVLAEAERAYEVAHSAHEEAVKGKDMVSMPMHVFANTMYQPLYSCPLVRKLGNIVDGGKWVCMSHCPGKRSPPIVVSIGCNGETSFEEAVHSELGAVPYTLDFSLNSTTAKSLSSRPFLRFSPLGLAGSAQRQMLESEFGDVFVNITQLLAYIKQSYVDIFKVDCEGCEYAVVDDMVREFSRETVPFGQILMEVHGFQSKKNLKFQAVNTKKLLDQLEGLGYRMFHTEINPYMALYGSIMYEVAFIHEDLVKCT